MKPTPALLLLPSLLMTSTYVLAQHAVPVPVPSLPTQPQQPAEPTSPPARHVRDPRAHLAFDLPAGWNLSRRDGELSTFALDARSAPEHAQMHAVANLNFNPFPYSTFSGAIFYVASTPHSSPESCASEAAAPVSRGAKQITLDGVPFRHGYSEIGRSCIEGRDEVYTAMRGGSCLRFDLVINTFCGESSGARDMTAGELASVERRLESILQSVHFDAAAATKEGSTGTLPSHSIASH